MTAMIRLPHLTWRQRLAIGAGCLVFAAVGGTELPSASATNAGTSAYSACIDGHWIVTMAVTSQYDGVIHVVLEDPHSPLTHTLEPFATFSVSEHPDAGSKSWTWRWSSPDGHLTGDAVSGTLPRPADCDVVPSTALTSTPTTEVTTSPSSTSPTTAVSPPPTSTSPASPVPAAGQATSTAPTNAPSRPTTSIASRIVLPTTGAGDWILAIAVIAGCLILIGLVLVTAKRVDRRSEGQQ